MGILDSFKNKYDDDKNSLDELNSQRGNKLANIEVDYIGGYEDKKPSHGDLKCYEHQIEYAVPLLYKGTSTPLLLRKGIIIRNSDIADMSFEGKDDIYQQRTITRNVLLAGKSKKQEIKEAYITLMLANGQRVMFKVKDKSPMEVKSKLANVASRVVQARSLTTHPASMHRDSIADELTKLANLKQQGVITQLEFDNKKRQLLS